MQTFSNRNESGSCIKTQNMGSDIDSFGNFKGVTYIIVLMAIPCVFSFFFLFIFNRSALSQMVILQSMLTWSRLRTQKLTAGIKGTLLQK